MKQRGLSRICLLLGLMIGGCGPAGPEITLTRGIVVRESSSIRQGTYLIPGVEDMSSPVVTIRGREIVLDFQGATVQGSVSEEDDQSYSGVGICLDQASNVTIRNLTLKGYEVGIHCKSCEGLQLENVELDGNTRPQEFTSLP